MSAIAEIWNDRSRFLASATPIRAGKPDMRSDYSLSNMISHGVEWGTTAAMRAGSCSMTGFRHCAELVKMRKIMIAPLGADTALAVKPLGALGAEIIGLGFPQAVEPETILSVHNALTCHG